MNLAPGTISRSAPSLLYDDDVDNKLVRLFYLIVRYRSFYFECTCAFLSTLNVKENSLVRAREKH